MLEALQAAEWGRDLDTHDDYGMIDGKYRSCPVCKNLATVGHKQDCKLAAAINANGVEPRYEQVQKVEAADYACV
jgi:predicted nucleic acid-binding Zn finger protein